ncbi:MAG: hypothetical protein IIB19_02510 [Chloroflexi bacterium]|nr:hypothetical protein [Chloroflexota bacterium]
MILPALGRGGYFYNAGVDIGRRLGVGRHVADVVAEAGQNRYLISLKWQQVSGTAEQKIPFEVICLAEAMQEGDFKEAYLVLGGDGWKLRDFYTSGGLARHLISADLVHIVTLERFVALANQGDL